MDWIECKYSYSVIDKAGKTLVSNATPEDIDNATKVLENWREAHSFPLFIYKKRLNDIAKKIDSKALVVQRLKRASSIIKKLERKQTNTMKLSQMQDIGGCRAVFSDVKLALHAYNKYYEKKLPKTHQDKKVKNYILEPKDDGYRSIHIICRYKGYTKNKFDGLLVEIQIRSKLQHLWATSLEMAESFTKYALKHNEGYRKEEENDWKDFFRLMSSVFANIEKTPNVKNAPTDKIDLHNKIKKLSEKLDVIKRLRLWSAFVKYADVKIKQKDNYYLLSLDLDDGGLTINVFNKDEEEAANKAYSEAEERKRKENKNKDIVLVSIDKYRDLKKAYPNYFFDTRDFLQILNEYLKNPDYVPNN